VLAECDLTPPSALPEKRRAGQKSLSAGQKKKNRRHSSIRAKVEHPFKVIKAQWGHAKVRHKGLFKNACQFTMLCGLSNLFFSQKALQEGLLALAKQV
jgi:transposase, IS5 family